MSIVNEYVVTSGGCKLYFHGKDGGFDVYTL